MTFVIDPRICLMTGKEIGSTGHDCCGIDYQLREAPSGLGAAYSEKVNHSRYRMQMVERQETWSKISGRELNAFGPDAQRDKSNYVPPSQSLDFLRSRRPSVMTQSRSAAIQVESDSTRRDSFVGMLRRMFGGKQV